MKILVLNGPNLNLLGTREPEIYGTVSLSQIESEVLNCSKELDVDVEFFQSNIEGELIDKIQQSPVEGIIINPAGYSYTSVALRDAISAVEKPTVEVHLSNIHSREEFRKNSIIAPVCLGQICGFGKDVYILALKGLYDYLKK